MNYNRKAPMETLNSEYKAKRPLPRRAHVGIVGSGDQVFSHFDHAAHVAINDLGATPETVTLRLEHAAEEVRS